MLLSIESISLSAIELSNAWSLHPWNINSCCKELEDSFTNLGILHPPILLQKDHAFEVLAGYKRLSYLRALHQNHDDAEIHCSIVPAEAPIERILDIILYDQQATSPLSTAEKAQFISLAASHFTEAEIIDKYFGKMLLKNKMSTFKTLVKLLKEDVVILKEADQNSIDVNMIENILQLRNQSDRIALVNLFKYLNLGGGKQKKFFTLLRDISGQSRTTIADFLSTKEIVSILHPKEINIPQIVNNLGRSFERLISPNYTAAEKEFSHKVNTLKLPSHYKITHSPSFEKDEVSLTLTFNSFEKCCEYLAAEKD